jgi:hypothetical protein
MQDREQFDTHILNSFDWRDKPFVPMLAVFFDADFYSDTRSFLRRASWLARGGEVFCGAWRYFRLPSCWSEALRVTSVWL